MRGQKFIGATGKPAYNSGEKKVEFRIASGGDRRCTFQTSDVNKMLACVAGLADGAGPGGENLVMFSSRGGVITPEAQTKTISPRDKQSMTEFDRKGNVYVMDIWVPADKAVGKSEVEIASFHRQGQR